MRASPLWNNREDRITLSVAAAWATGRQRSPAYTAQGIMENTDSGGKRALPSDTKSVFLSQNFGREADFIVSLRLEHGWATETGSHTLRLDTAF